MSPDTIARWQFGITTVYHFLFVPITISMSVLVAVLQSAWVKTGKDAYLRLTKFFGKLFLINFAMGVVTGIVQEFQFGMNWSEYSRFVGDIFGAPLALEALIAFFLESTFLGLWIFGWDRLSKKVHLTTIWLAAIGTVVSSIFIIAANAWMQNPVGATYNAAAGRAELVSLMDVILNPVFLMQWPHTIFAAFITGGAFLASIAFYLLVRKNADGAPKDDLVAYKKAVKLGAWVMIVAGVGIVITGDLLGKDIVQYQPAKMAAAENMTVSPADGQAPFTLVPGVHVFPGFLNWLYGADHIPSLTDIQTEYAQNGYAQYDVATGQFVDCHVQTGDRVCTQLQREFADTLAGIQGQTVDPIPNSTVAFWTFRLMITTGLLAVLGGILLLIVTRGSHIPRRNPFWTAVAIVLPLLPLAANSFGWTFTEMGRQPWIVNGVLPTLQGLSPIVGNAAWLTVVLYTVLYGALAVVEVGLLLKYIKPGLPEQVSVSVKDEAEPLSFAY